MRKISKKNKKGFTLLELMLSIAIIAMISGLFVVLIVSIKDSYMTVYNQNDSADYAMLFARGFEQAFYRYVNYDVAKGSYVYEVKNSLLYCNSTGVFPTAQNKTKEGKTKWDIYMGFQWDSDTNVVKYKVNLVDNYYNPGKLTYSFKSSIMVPHFNSEVGSISLSKNPFRKSGQVGYETGDEKYMDSITYKKTK